jgi:hypothetical protein
MVKHFSVGQSAFDPHGCGIGKSGYFIEMGNRTIDDFVVFVRADTDTLEISRSIKVLW